MTDRMMTRRRLLATLAGAGSVGAITGGTTTALFVDNEAFFANTFASGVIDTQLSPTTPVQPTGDDPATVTVELPDTDSNNPSYVWLQITCPTGDTARADEIVVRLAYENGPTITQGTLTEVATRLRDGLVVSPTASVGAAPGTQACFDPGEQTVLVLELLEQSEGDQVMVELTVVARQCRNHPGEFNPFATTPVTDGCAPWAQKAISYVAFCSLDSRPTTVTADDVSISVVDTKSDGDDEPIAVEWTSTVPVDTVVTAVGKGGGGGRKGGGRSTNKKNSQLASVSYDGATTGRVEAGVGAPPDSDQTINDPCPSGQSGVKFEYDGTRFSPET